MSLLRGWLRERGLPVPSGDNGAYCKARARMKDGFLEAVAGKATEALGRGVREEDRWNGFVLKAVDGSSVQLADTPANQREFPQPSGQKEGCGFPVMGVSGLLNLSHGGWEAMATGPASGGDLAMAGEFLPRLGEGDLLLADRAYCSYAFIAAVRGRGAHVVARLHQAREKALDWRKGKRLSRFERLVTWRRPGFASLSKSLSREEWEALPEEMGIRLVRLRFEDRSGKVRWMTVATTLTDAGEHDGAEIHALHARRWEIETRLRDVKTTMGFEFLRARSPDMARKTLLVLLIAFNLMRILMQRAAREAGTATGKVSFKAVLDLATSLHGAFRHCAGKPRKRAGLLGFLVEALSRRLVGGRPFRSEPRAVKRRPKPFPLLTAPRHEYVEIPHRSKYRKPA